MANMKYVLFGSEFIESQGAMMTRVFKELLSRHPEKLNEAVEQFTCLTTADLSANPEDLRSAPNAFLNKHCIIVGKFRLYIGTSYSLQQKLMLISRLFKLLNEDENQFYLKNQSGIYLSENQNKNKALKSANNQISYRLFDKEYQSTQSEMMYRVFEKVLSQDYSLADWAVENLNCVSKTDYTDFNNRDFTPSVFKSCRTINIGNRAICIGTSLNFKAKQTAIDKLFARANLPAQVFKMNRFDSKPKLIAWQKDAVRAVLSRLDDIGTKDCNLGIVSQATGMGKSAVLAEIIRLSLKKHERVQSILVLTNNTDIAEQYKEYFDRLSCDLYNVESANSVKDLISCVKKNDTVAVATVQKLLASKYTTKCAERDEIEPFSESENLLVIVVEIASYHYGNSRIYSDIKARFPNAVFLGMTQDPEPSEQLIKHFGPLIYRYTCEQAFFDGLFDTVYYEKVDTVPTSPDYNSSHKSEYDEKLQKLTEFIVARENGKKESKLLLCKNQATAVDIYKSLLPALGAESIKLNVALSRTRAGKSSDFKADTAWNGKCFNGLSIACSADLSGNVYDAVYLYKNLTKCELIAVLSMLSYKSKKRKGVGFLVDFCDNQNLINSCISDKFPLINTDSSAYIYKDTLNDSLTRLADSLKSRDYSTVRNTLSVINKNFPKHGQRLSEQLEFLFPENISIEQYSRYWQQYSSELSWKSDMWCLLSADSVYAWSIPEEACEENTNAFRENDETSIDFITTDGTSQERGAILEKETKQLIRALFDLSPDYTLDELRLQSSGKQFGFDITFTYTDAHNAQCICMIECKNYQKDIRPRDIVDKLSELRTNNTEVDHWILISPTSNATNTLQEQYIIWQKHDLWYPVRDVQIWTPDQMVNELFGLFPHIYSKFYRIDDNSPLNWSEEKRQKILTHWKQKIAPVPHLPQSWKKYLKNPGCLLTQYESDRITVSEYEALYQYRATARLLDENGLSIEGTAEEYFLKWLNQSDKSASLLLGDFGDGKTYFTYTLSRRLCENFLNSPKVGWIPLRISLRDTGNSSIDFRKILEQRLDEFSSNIGEWNNINREYRFLIILDGFDEMSQGMNDTAVFDNLQRLEEIIGQFKGHKILLTSRKNVIYSDSIRKRLISLLEQPEIVHLAPLTNKERLAFLERLADTQQKKKRLYNIRNTHDLLGLAAKPLFLNTIRAQLDDGNIRAMDMADIYCDYAKKVLMRKYNNQLGLSSDYTPSSDVCSRLFKLLEELAMCLQYEGIESISLDSFKKYINHDNLAKLLWDSVDTDSADIAEDAEKRLTNRSLLKYDSVCTENRAFCHRSMKEYFVARGIVRLLSENSDNALAFLKSGSLGYEILEFAGKTIKKMNRAQKTEVAKKLTAFVFLSRYKHKDPNKEQFSVLSSNCVNLLHYSNIGLIGQSWQGLLLDNAVLSNENLSHKDMSFCSMRYAHLDNADLTGCNLSGCDLTGVRFEKSGQLISFAVNPQETNLIACYKDGKLREWETHTGNTKTVAVIPPESQLRLIIAGENKEGIVSAEFFRFWQRTAESIKFTGYLPIRHGVRLWDFNGNSVLVGHNGGLFLLRLSDNEIIYQREITGQYKACLFAENVIALLSEEKELELINTIGNRSDCISVPNSFKPQSICATAFSNTTGLIAVCGSESKIKLFNVTSEVAKGDWTISSDTADFKCDERIFDISIDSTGGIYVATESGAIKRYFFNGNNDGDLVEERCYRLELKCRGAKIDGVYPKEQYMILKNAIANR